MRLKRGDVVMVVKPKPCCGAEVALGRIFTITDIGSHTPVRCLCCGTMDHRTAQYVGNSDGHYREAYRLIKIDPPANMKDEETRKELTV